MHHLYYDQDINCARTTLLCLGELFNLTAEPSVLKAAIGLHGAGGFRAQCGLVEGALMMIGIYFSEKGLSDEEIAQLCCQYVKRFTEEFGSLRCLELRPGGFTQSAPPHLFGHIRPIPALPNHPSQNETNVSSTRNICPTKMFHFHFFLPFHPSSLLFLKFL